MSCDKIKTRCGKVQYATCTKYETELPAFSTLQCPSIEETTEELYNEVANLKDLLDFSDLNDDCLTLPTPRNPLSLIQLLIDTVCEQKNIIENMQGTIDTIQDQITDLQENNCP